MKLNHSEPLGTLIGVMKQALLELANRGVIKSLRHNINLYMPLTMVTEFRKIYRQSLSKRNRTRYAKLLSNNTVVLRGYKVQIRTKHKGVPLLERGDGFADIWIQPV